MKIGSRVRVMPPFDSTFKDIYVVSSIETSDDGYTVFFLDGVNGGFCADYIEEV